MVPREACRRQPGICILLLYCWQADGTAATEWRRQRRLKNNFILVALLNFLVRQNEGVPNEHLVGNGASLSDHRDCRGETAIGGKERRGGGGGTGIVGVDPDSIAL